MQLLLFCVAAMQRDVSNGKKSPETGQRFFGTASQYITRIISCLG